MKRFGTMLAAARAGIALGGPCSPRQSRTGAGSLRAAILALALSASGAFAQATEAARYVNAQGIEVIQARRTVAPEQIGGKRETQGRAVEAAKSVPKPSAVPAVFERKFLISTKEQTAREQDRLAILQAELRDETAAFESKLKILHAPATDPKLSPDERQRIQETLIRHQNNIRALNGEIGRIR